MSDVRALLRSEKRTRRLAHPDLTYSSSGALRCLVCNIQVKAESLWDQHTKSPIHLNAKRLSQDLAAGVSASKKRKADDDGASFNTVERKKTKPVTRSLSKEPAQRTSGAAPSSDVNLEAVPEVIEEESMEQNGALPVGFFDGTNGSNSIKPSEASRQPPEQSPTIKDAVDEDEWAAFEKDIELATKVTEADYSAATISAPAMTTAEIQARSAEEAALSRKDQREVEAEGEKEDATRQMEEEFDAMEAYESRAKKLREQREALRTASRTEGDGQPGHTGRAMAVEDLMDAPNVHGTKSQVRTEEEDDEDEDDSEDEWDGWRISK